MCLRLCGCVGDWRRAVFDFLVAVLSVTSLSCSSCVLRVCLRIIVGVPTYAGSQPVGLPSTWLGRARPDTSAVVHCSRCPWRGVDGGVWL
ncbi:hypothetical protein BC567DRAFT_227341 [Phyllosticta citribraziliensis]